MNFPKVLISIVNWMNYWDTISCITLCKEQLYENIEIIVIDNASKNESVEKIKTAHPDVLLIRNKKNKGFAGGHAIAYKYALENKFDAIWLLNPDSEIFMDTLEQLVNAYEKYGNGIYGAIKVDENLYYLAGAGKRVNDDFIIDNSFNYKDVLFGKPVKELQGQIIKTSNVEGSSFFIPLALTKIAGFLSEKYFMYAEDLDYCYKVNKKKINCYLVCDALYRHHSAQSFAINRRLLYLKTYYSIRNYILFAMEYDILLKKKVVKDNGGILSIIKKIFFKKNNDEYYYTLGVFHALMGIKGKKLSPENYL